MHRHFVGGVRRWSRGCADVAAGAGRYGCSSSCRYADVFACAYGYADAGADRYAVAYGYGYAGAVGYACAGADRRAYGCAWAYTYTYTYTCAYAYAGTGRDGTLRC